LRVRNSGIVAWIVLFAAVTSAWLQRGVHGSTNRTGVVVVGERLRVVIEPGLISRFPPSSNTVDLKSIMLLGSENPSQEVIACGSETAGGRCIAR